MANPPIGYNVQSLAGLSNLLPKPGGKGMLERSLGIDLTDPATYLAQLKARKKPVADTPHFFPPPGSSEPIKAPPPNQAPQPNQSSSAPTTNVTTRPSRAGIPSFDTRKAAAQSMYEAELDAFAERERQGFQVDPLSRKRALERFNNSMAQADAIAQREQRQKQFWDRRREEFDKRNERKAKRKAAFTDLNKSADAMVEQSMQTAQPVKSVDELNAEYSKKLGQDYQAQQARNAAAAVKANAAGTDTVDKIGGGLDWLENAINQSVKTLQEAARSTPTGQLSEIAAPEPVDIPVPANLPPQPRNWNDPLGEVSSLPRMDPMLSNAAKTVSDRYKKFGVDPMDPNVSSRYMQDVEREMVQLTPGGQIGAPQNLPIGQSPSWGETILNTIAGPGGLIGAPLPPKLAQREIATAPTEAARSVAQGRETMGAMQEPFWTFVGGGLVPAMKGGSVPQMTATPTRVIDNPTLQGQTKPRIVVSPDRAVSIRPGSEGQVVTPPPAQGIPGVTPRDFPRSTGPNQGPMLAPLDFPAPTPGRVGGPGAARVQARAEQGLFPFAERATNPSNAKNPNVIGQFKIDESGPSFQKVVDPESGVNGAFTVIKPEGPSQEDRLVVFANVGGETIPFYRSQGGTSGKQQGSFYPFPGISAEDWLVKGTSQDKSSWANYNEYYNNPGFRKVAEYLNSKYGRESLQEARSLLERDFGKPVEGPDGANQNIRSYALINKAAGNRAVNVVNAMKDVKGPADPRVMPELLKWNLRTFPEQYWQGVPWANTPDPVSNLAEIPGQMTLPGFER